MLEQKNMIVKYLLEKYAFLYLEQNNNLPDIKTAMIFRKFRQTFLQTFLTLFK